MQPEILPLAEPKFDVPMNPNSVESDTCRYTLSLNTRVDEGGPASHEAIVKLVTTHVTSATLMRTAASEVVRYKPFRKITKKL